MAAHFDFTSFSTWPFFRFLAATFFTPGVFWWDYSLLKIIIGKNFAFTCMHALMGVKKPDILYWNSDMILEVGYIISEFGYDIRLTKSCVTTLYGLLT